MKHLAIPWGLLLGLLVPAIGLCAGNDPLAGRISSRHVPFGAESQPLVRQDSIWREECDLPVDQLEKFLARLDLSPLRPADPDTFDDGNIHVGIYKHPLLIYIDGGYRMKVAMSGRPAEGPPHIPHGADAPEEQKR
jgi:hypothetical protein